MIGQFKSFDDILYTVQIGTSTEEIILAADPVHLTWDKGDDVYQPIRSIQASIRILTDKDLSELYTDNPLGVSVTISKTEGDEDSVIFKGYLTPQTWDAPYTKEYDEVEVVAVDALSALKNISYTIQSYPYMRTPGYIISQAAYQVGCTFDTSQLAWNEENIPESAFLPKLWNESIYSSQRMKWTDVLSALGRYMRVTFVLYGTELIIEDMDTVAGTPTEVSINYKSTDIRKSIEPARSSIKVNYKSLAMMPLAWSIDDDRMDAYIQHEYTQGSYVEIDGEYITDNLVYYQSKDWESIGTTKPCGLEIYPKADYVGDGSRSSTWAIVGPAKIVNNAQRLCSAKTWTTTDPFTSINTQRQLIVKLSLWARSDIPTDSDGYKITKVLTQKSNVANPQLTLHVTTPSGRSTETITCTLDTGKRGFQDYETRIPFFSNWARYYLEIPSEVVLHSVTIEIGDTVKAKVIDLTDPDYGKKRKTKLSEVENDGVVTINNSYNPSINVDAVLRPCTFAYAPGDIEPWNVSGLAKFPYITAEQYASTRARFTLEMQRLDVTPLNALKITSLSSKSLLIDSADINLRDATMKVNLLESFISAT